MIFSPTDFIAICNQSLENAYANITIEGEIASFKINQGKWVFFDVKDQQSSINCFLPLYRMRFPLEDGMKVRLIGTPKLTAWGRFSFTVQHVVPVGEGNLKKSLEILKAKLAKEGLFAPEKKRPLPGRIYRIGVISSTQAAGYADFIKILNERWGGLKIQVAHTQVQGMQAPDQIIRALDYLNEKSDVQIIAIIRGGGSADDLSAFNDEQLVRAIARSKIPVITGIGHEVDESLADLAADIRASTPSNAAQLITYDRAAVISTIHSKVTQLGVLVDDKIASTTAEIFLQLSNAQQFVNLQISTAASRSFERIHSVDQLVRQQTLSALAENHRQITGVGQLLLQRVSTAADPNRQIAGIRQLLAQKISTALAHIHSQIKLVEHLNPEKVLIQGYSIVTGKLSPGSVVKITTQTATATAEVKQVEKRSNYD